MSADLIVFLAGTAAIVVFSWRFSIRAGRYHGIARFFAFDGLWALFVINRRVWFARPFSPPQLLSWFFLFASLGLAVAGAWLLVRRGRPEGQIENTTKLVTTGLYRYLRHPLYASLFYLGLGIWLKGIDGASSLLLAAVVAAVMATALIEEGEMKARFGDEYAAYMKTTKRFVPFLF
ncbi:MAG: isoprenylcysteine carboxylmethyltransferase family protein [Acidobacteriota bacterium]|nr:isoprenylcysteine carboxylmethyltransferase family protein [Acidobacteriota bacterium]